MDYMNNFAHGPDAIYFVKVEPDMFISILYGTKDGVPMDPSHIQVPRDLDWTYDAQQLQAVREEDGSISIVRKEA